MSTAVLGRELVIRVTDYIGALADIAKIVAEKGVSILGISGTIEEDEAVIRMVTDDNLRAFDALLEQRFPVREEKVVLVRLPHKPGVLRHMTDVLRDADIGIRRLFATADLDDSRCLLVLSSTENDRAVVEINRAHPSASTSTSGVPVSSKSFF